MLYVPDFMLNAGGVINCYAEVKGLSSEWAKGKAQEIYNTSLNLINRSRETNTPTYVIANQMAEERIDAVGKVKLPM